MRIRLNGPNAEGEYFFHFVRSANANGGGSWTLMGKKENYDKVTFVGLGLESEEIADLVGEGDLTTVLSKGRKIWQHLVYNGFIEKGVEVELEEEK
jgi:hypothetical protein